MSHTDLSNGTEMVCLEKIPLIIVEDQDNLNHETWLYILKDSRPKKTINAVQGLKDDPPLSVLNSTINLKDTTPWLENIIPEDVMLPDPIHPQQTVSENDQSKIIDTRTFTRPRKSPLRPLTLPPQSVESETTITTKLNSTFNSSRNISSIQTKEILLNTTVVYSESTTPPPPPVTDVNATFQIIDNFSADEDDDEQPPSSPCNNNNNVYHHLNSTFATRVTNTTYQAQEEEDDEELGVVVATSPSLPSSPVDDHRGGGDETFMFRKPALPGAVPKRTLVRTSTLINSEPAPMSSSPIKKISNISPPATMSGDIEKNARLQEESLTQAQTSTPMGKRSLSALRRTAAMDPNLGSPISSLTETDCTVNYGPPVPISQSLAATNNANSDPALFDNASRKLREGHLTFEKSQNSFEMQSNSPTSPAGSPYSSQSLESDSAVSVSTQDLIRRSMPNLNNPPSRMRLPQPAAMMTGGGGGSNLNRGNHGGSDSGLRPPSVSGLLRPQLGSAVNGSFLVRPQIRGPQTSFSSKDITSTSALESNDKSNLHQPQRVSSVGSMAPPSRNSLLPNFSRLRAPQKQSVATAAAKPAPSAVGRSSIIPVHPAASKVTEDMNATVVVDKPTADVSSRPFSGIPRPGIPRPSMSKIPGPKARSAIPTMAFRPRAPQ